MEFLSFLLRLRQSVVLWQDRGGIQKIALFYKRPSPYHGKNSSKKRRKMTVRHNFKTWSSVNLEHFKTFESCFKCSRKNHQALWWNWLSWGPTREDPELPLLQRKSSLELTAPQIAAQINASHSSSDRHISTSAVQRRLCELEVNRLWFFNADTSTDYWRTKLKPIPMNRPIFIYVFVVMTITTILNEQ